MVLTNFDLEEIADKIGINLVGVYNKDNLPKRRIVGSYVINLSDSRDGEGNQLPGSHWVGLKIYPDGEAIYFDSFGIAPPESVKKFSGIKNLPYNNKMIQNIKTTICGYYAIAFLNYMKRPSEDIYKQFNNFLDMFSDNVLKNRKILERYLKPFNGDSIRESIYNKYIEDNSEDEEEKIKGGLALSKSKYI